MQRSLYLSTSKCLFISLFLCAFFNYVFNQQDFKLIKIGAIFEGSNGDLENVFRKTIDQINLDKNRLTRSRLEVQVARINTRDSFHAAKEACNLIENGVWAIFGPQSPSVGWLIRSIADNLHLPHFLMNWDYRGFRRHRMYPSNMTVNLHPEPSALSQAFADLVESRKWKSFALVYEENEELVKLKDVLRVPNMRMLIRQLPPSVDQYRKMFKDITRSGETNIVLSISLEKINETLIAAKDVGLMTDYNNYLIANLDMHKLDLSNFTQTNITGLSLHVHPWKKTLTVEEALLSDAIYLFTAALDQLDRTQSPSPPSLNCESPNPWAFGSIFMSILQVVNVRGLTGRIKLDEFGRRSDFALDILELKKTGFQRTGTWDLTGKVNITRNFTAADADIKEALKNKTLRVTVPANAAPYVMFKENYLNLTGNDRFEGYCAELVDEIAKLLGFKYELYQAPNNAYGTPKNGEWNGMIRELLDHRADMAIADLTITSGRQTAVDFTLPFMNLGISILFKKPEETPPDLFSFLKPFSIEVWLYVATAFLAVSLLLYGIARLSPYEWVSGHPCDDDPDELENQFSLGNCLWFSLGSIMQQGSDLSPRALSTRTLASSWWFFTLIIISSYTANLAAFLTVSRMASPIENVDDLAKQTTIQYGCKYEGATYNFFKTSNHTTYERMWSAMESVRPSVFVDSNQKGIDRVKKGNYAFLMESTTIEYEIQRNCDLMQIGGMLDSKGYGIATPPDSPYRGFLSEAILSLQESGRLEDLKKRWWVDRFVEMGITCPPDAPAGGMELDVGNVGGVFVVLFGGTGVGCLLVIIEFVWKTKKVSRHERDHAVIMMWKELVRICSGGGGHRTTGSGGGSSNSGSSSSSSSAGSNGSSPGGTGTGIPLGRGSSIGSTSNLHRRSSTVNTNRPRLPSPLHEQDYDSNDEMERPTVRDIVSRLERESTPARGRLGNRDTRRKSLRRAVSPSPPPPPLPMPLSSPSSLSHHRPHHHTSGTYFSPSNGKDRPTSRIY